MKKTILFAATALVMAGCGSINPNNVASALNTAANATATAANVANTVSGATTTTTLPAAEAGKEAGNNLKALLAQYLLDGKFDYKNADNINNTLALVSNCSALPANIKNKEYRKEFGTGLIGYSGGIVNQENVDAVTDKLTEMTSEYSAIVSKEATASERLTATSSALTSVSNILSLFGK